MKTSQATALLAALGLTGCVLPFPNNRVVAPSIQGRVIHAHTGAPVDMAGVTVKGFKEASVLTSRDGEFKTDRITRSRIFWVWWPFGGNHVSQVELRVGRPGFAKREEKVSWNPKTQSHVVLSQPIALTPKSKDEVKDEVLKRLGRDHIPGAAR